MWGMCEKGSVLLRGVTFSCGFFLKFHCYVLFAHLQKGSA